MFSALFSGVEFVFEYFFPEGYHLGVLIIVKFKQKDVLKNEFYSIMEEI